jgi:hypothetical protein
MPPAFILLIHYLTYTVIQVVLTSRLSGIMSPWSTTSFHHSFPDFGVAAITSANASHR